MTTSSGIHHITAITTYPQENLDFYEGFLGQRLIKKTVNFDDPSAYHFYFGDAYGRPGTLLTFFYWPNIPPGTHGAGEVSRIAYSISAQAKDYWIERAKESEVPCTEAVNVFGETTLTLTDPDGLSIELVVIDKTPQVDFWQEGPVPKESILHGFYGATLTVVSVDTMERVLGDGLGYKEVGREGTRARFVSSVGRRAHILDVIEAPNLPAARQGSGSVHHIAFRAETGDEELEIREQVAAAGTNPTPVIEREYFRSVYFVTPGSVLFEIATDGPGFTIDEPAEELGEGLMLPPQYEPYRSEIERLLVPVTLPRDRA